MEDRATRLAGKLEALSEAAIDRLRQVIDLPFGTPISEDDGRLLRAHVAASLGALNTQVKVDAMRMRAAREDKAMAALLALIAAKENGIPCDVKLEPTGERPAAILEPLGGGSAVSTAA